MTYLAEIVEYDVARNGPKIIRVSADDALVTLARADACTLAPDGRIHVNCEGNEVLEQIWTGLVFMQANRETFAALA